METNWMPAHPPIIYSRAANPGHARAKPHGRDECSAGMGEDMRWREEKDSTRENERTNENGS